MVPRSKIFFTIWYVDMYLIRVVWRRAVSQSNEDQAESQSPSRPVVVSDGILAMIAGSDTTATTIVNIFYLLLNHKDKFRILQEEVDKYYPHGEDPLNSKHYVEMHYLEAVMSVPILILKFEILPRTCSATRLCGYSPLFLAVVNEHPLVGLVEKW